MAAPGLLWGNEGLGLQIGQKLLAQMFPVVVTPGETQLTPANILKAGEACDRVMVLLARDSGLLPGGLARDTKPDFDVEPGTAATPRSRALDGGQGGDALGAAGQAGGASPASMPGPSPPWRTISFGTWRRIDEIGLNWTRLSTKRAAMKLPPEGARWLVSLRFGACAGVFLVTTAAWLLGVLPQPLPLYAVGGMVLAYNLFFRLSRRDAWAITPQSVERNILLQILLDLAALALLLYFAGLPQNPFLSFFVFHMIIAGMYLRGNLPYLIAAAATFMVGSDHAAGVPGMDPPLRSAILSGAFRPWLYLLTVFAALASTLWIAVYFTTAIRRYVDRAHAELRQKEKLLGIGQLVAGIAHEIANPLDGVQNCLQRIGETVRDDPRLTEYVQMMVAALDRIERTAKRVQAFALPHGVTLQATDLNAVVEATLSLLGPTRRNRVQVQTELKDVPPVQGDPYTLQEVLFNLCINALAAMPRGGTLDTSHALAGRRRR